MLLMVFWRGLIFWSKASRGGDVCRVLSFQRNAISCVPEPAICKFLLV
jgi:thiamine transporter ThiT